MQHLRSRGIQLGRQYARCLGARSERGKSGAVISVPFGRAAYEEVARTIQGNLDPITIFTPWSDLKLHIDSVLEAVGGHPGHIFNLGYSLHKSTPVDNVRRLVDYVHERTRNR